MRITPHSFIKIDCIAHDKSVFAVFHAAAEQVKYISFFVLLDIEKATRN